MKLSQSILIKDVYATIKRLKANSVTVTKQGFMFCNDILSMFI